MLFSKLFFPVVILLSQVDSILSSLSPVVFLPGYSGSLLFATVKAQKFVPVECENVVPVDVPFRVLGNVTLEANYPKCVQQLMKLEFDPSTGDFFPVEGIEISTGNDYEGIAPVYWPFSKTLTSWGYQNLKNSFGQPYDYRYLGSKSLANIGFTSALKQVVEKAFNWNKQTKVILIGHSNGGPTLYYFLSSMTIEWKEKYLAAVIGLSGNFLGQLNAIKSFVYSDDETSQDMLNSWEAQYNSFTWGGYTPPQVVVTTYFNTSNEKKYSSSTADILELLENTKKSDWVERYKATSGRNNPSIAPSGVDIYCLYGQSVNTSSAFIFEENVMTTAPIETIYSPGDGNQDNIDNTYCLQWKEEVEKDGKHVLEAVGYDGVHHMQMYLDENVLNKIHEIVLKYSD